MIWDFPLLKTSSKILGLCLILVMPTAQAVPIAFNLNITMTRTNANLGTGVSVGDTFTGVMFFDSADLVDGSRARSILPGNDSVSIAGLTFDETLNSRFLKFSFDGGAPLCISDWQLDGCGTGEGQSIHRFTDDHLLSGDYLSFYDNFTGRIRDSILDVVGGPYEYATFTYSFERVPEPPLLLLMLTGLAGLVFAGRLKQA